MLMEGTVIVEVMVLFLHVKKGVQNLVSFHKSGFERLEVLLYRRVRFC